MHEQYTIRRKVFAFLGKSFHIYDEGGAVVGFCRQKALRLKEDLRIYTSPAKDQELLLIKARNVIDWWATYDIKTPDGILLGSVRRKGMSSSLIRDHWLIFDVNENEIGSVLEDSAGLGFARRFLPFVSLFSPQSYTIQRKGEKSAIATLRTHANIFIRRLGIAIHGESEEIPELFVLAIGCLLAAMESRTEG